MGRVREGRKEPLIVRCIVRLPVSSQVEKWKEQVTFHLFTPKLKQPSQCEKCPSGKGSSPTISRSLARVSFRGERKITSWTEKGGRATRGDPVPLQADQIAPLFPPQSGDAAGWAFPALCVICDVALVELAHLQAAPSGYI
jgi:hypothetical protein